MSAAVRDEIKRAYKLIYRSGLNVSQAVEIMRNELLSPEVQHLVKFIENSKRGILDGANGSEETLKARLNKASYEMTFKSHFNKVILNDDLQRTCEEAENIVRVFLNIHHSADSI